MMNSEHSGHVAGASLLIAGTCIGGGMLALPVLTSLGGFVPSLFLFVACWLFMASTGLLYLEVCLWMKGETNIVSMAEKTMGKFGRASAWAFYLFLFYTLTVAYMSVSIEIVQQFTGDNVSESLAVLLFVGLLAPFVYLGATAVDKINSLFMLGLGLSYIAFIVLGAPHVKAANLEHKNWALSLLALPVAFTTFGFQGIIPTVVSYLDFRAKDVRKAIWIGSAIPVFTYMVWEWLIHGIVPVHGAGGLIEALEKNYSAIKPLKALLQDPRVTFVGNSFAFFAVVTSFLGVTLGLRDFLADGLKMEKDRKGRFALCLCIFLPPLLVTLIYPNIFLHALRYAGGFGSAFLLGLLPIIMVWRGRYSLNFTGEKQVAGGKATLVLLLLFIAIELLCEFLHLFQVA
jgi:tyrosine-specific transport protein